MIINTQIKKVGLAASDRKGHIGGSTIGAVAGEKGFVTRMQVAKTFLGQAVEFSASDRIRLADGHIFEETAASMFEARSGIKLEKCDFAYCDADHEEFILHPDREFSYDGKRYGLEIKAVNTNSARHSWGLDDSASNAPVIPGFGNIADSSAIPNQYYAQTQWYYAMNNYDGVFLLRFTDNDVTLYYVESDVEYQKWLHASGLRFIENMRNGIMPEPETLEDVKMRYPIASAGKVLTADDSLAGLILQCKFAAENEKTAKKQRDALELEIKRQMGDNEVIRDSADNVLITWKSTVSNKFSSSAFKTANPELYKQFTMPSPVRTFLIK